ncbi:hypothetical protein R6Q59_017842 [Mikania micrantha]
MILNDSSSTNGLNQSLTHLISHTKTSPSSFGTAPIANDETQGLASGDKKTWARGHTATSVRRVPVSRIIQKRLPTIHIEANTVKLLDAITPTALPGLKYVFEFY